jgi:hypothetical protein
MVIPIFWTERSAIPNLEELRSKVHQQGGSIVQYQRIYSIFIFSQSSTTFEWVPPGKSRTKAGLKHVAFSCALGWWSAGGMLATPAVIINNLMGGIDVTRILTEPPPLPGDPFDSTAIAELQRAQKRQQYVFLGFLLFILLVVGAWLIIYYAQGGA